MNPKLDELRRKAAFLALMCEEDERAFADAIEGETDAYEMLNEAYNGYALDVEAITGIKARMTALNERLKRLEDRKDARRAYMAAIMEAAGITKAPLIEATLSVRAGKAKLDIADPDAVPTEYQRVTYAPDKTKINDAFADADELPNWLTRTEAGSVITIRSK